MPAPSRITCVSFDLGNTVVYPDPAVGQVLAETLGRRGVRTDPDAMEARYVEVCSAMRARPETASATSSGPEARRWWRLAVGNLLTEFALGTPAEDEVFDEVWRHFGEPSSWRFYDDALPTFDALRARGLSLIALTNWDLRLVPIARGLGLYDIFDAVTISGEVGIEKPDPTIFAQALEAAGVRPDEVVHVGDSYAQDVLGARQCGIRALWLCRDDGPPSEHAPPEEAHPDTEIIRSLSELPGRIV